MISQLEQICKWRIEYAQSWRQSTWVVLVAIATHIPSFINVAHTELWIFDVLVISQSEQMWKWGIEYAHSVTTDLCPPLPTYKFYEKLHSHWTAKVYFLMLTISDIHPSIQTALQMKTKWSFKHSWRPTKKKKKKKKKRFLLEGVIKYLIVQ